ncbi:hypothetical protein CSB09_00090 [Candidatus Gracilibacteria bacterium]|nr:MAG: hypothetical protein CSB09_00090 [Candidatus Gracilibacteria bacterium]
MENSAKKTAQILRNAPYKKIFQIKQSGWYTPLIYTLTEKQSCKNQAQKYQKYRSEYYMNCLFSKEKREYPHNEVSLPSYGFLLTHYGKERLDACDRELGYNKTHFYNDFSQKRFSQIEKEKGCLEKNKEKIDSE